MSPPFRLARCISNTVLTESVRNREKDIPVLVPIHDAREDVVRVGARADEEEDHEEEGLEVEERCLLVRRKISELRVERSRGKACHFGWVVIRWGKGAAVECCELGLSLGYGLQEAVVRSWKNS